MVQAVHRGFLLLPDGDHDRAFGNPVANRMLTRPRLQARVAQPNQKGTREGGHQAIPQRGVLEQESLALFRAMKPNGGQVMAFDATLHGNVAGSQDSLIAGFLGKADGRELPPLVDRLAVLDRD